MRKWQQEGWDIHSIFDYALSCHASYLNNKSAPIPAGTRGEIEHFLRKLGYRLVLRCVEYDSAVAPGSRLHAAMLWENVGVAPPFRDYRGGASRDPQQSQAQVQQACYWTGGHLSLTQRLCRAIAEDATVVAAPGVDRLCEFSYQGGSKRCVGLGPP
jgi:hypothetical protein